MKKNLLLLISFLLPMAAHCQQRYWQQSVSYSIDATLNDQENTIDGFIKIKYSNQSPDTLSFIWFHLWPNAFKNDQTFFSEQRLENGKTDFYFCDKEQHGYINRLDFRVGGLAVKTEDHPLYIDIVKIKLPTPLFPGKQIEITTPFHEKLPANFSGYGHIGQSYQLTQWYPKPAVYDQKGWHEMPYPDQGKVYSEPAHFEVHITLPENYIVAASGTLHNDTEKKWLIEKSLSDQLAKIHLQKPGPAITTAKQADKKIIQPRTPRTSLPPSPESALQTKTLIYTEENAPDFVWFADKQFLVAFDSLSLEGGKTIDLFCFYFPESNPSWSKCLSFVKQSIRFRNSLIGAYPYPSCAMVATKIPGLGALAYPEIGAIPSYLPEEKLKQTIQHLIGEHWFYGSLSVDEGENSWMDEGMNTYYDNLFNLPQFGLPLPYGEVPQKWLQKKIPNDFANTVLATMEWLKKDQPIQTKTANFTTSNQYLIASQKAANWMGVLENMLGKEQFTNCMKAYYDRWQHKHPYPEDFKKLVEAVSGKKLDTLFALLSTKGSLSNQKPHKILKPAFLFDLRESQQYRYLSFFPAVGYNFYDRFMIGAAIHNFNLPPSHFQFLLIPLYATNSRQLNGIGTVNYSWFPDKGIQEVEIGLGGARFSTMTGVDSNSIGIFGGFYKIVPSLRFILKNRDPRTSREDWIELKTFLIGENAFNYTQKSTDSLYYPSPQKYNTRYLNQLTYHLSDHRVLYPYQVSLQLQQATDFYRLNLTGNYFFNYEKGGGMNLRFFAAKFGYIGNSAGNTLNTQIYQPQLTASGGNQDYTYSNYFIGRNENTGLAGQQIIMQDGGLKLRLNQFPFVTGQSQNWVAAFNFNSSLPASIVPPQLPLKVFLDIGSYAEAWGTSPTTSKFLYVGGLQLSLFKNIFNVYAPFVYSSDFRNVLKTLGSANSFLQKISFSIDIQQITARKIFKNYPF